MSVIFNPPPQWRTYLPANFVPEAEWTPPTTWASIPAGWALWIDAETGLPADAPGEYRGNIALNLPKPLSPVAPSMADDEVSNTRDISSATASTIHEIAPGLSPAQGTSTTSRSKSKFFYASIALVALAVVSTVTYFLLGSQEPVTTSSIKEPSSVSSPEVQPPQATNSGASNALREANELLSMNGLSAKGLREQLEFSGYTTEESQYALDNVTADWNEHAIRAANQLLDGNALSPSGLADTLKFSGFTEQETKHALENISADWNEHAVKAAKQMLDSNALSRSGLSDTLKFSGFTEQQVKHALENISADWNEHAVKASNQMLDSNVLSPSGLADTLKYSGFTEQQVKHALKNVSADWNENARRAAKDAIEQSPFSKQQLIDYLEMSGFSRNQAEEGVKATGL